MRIVSDAMYGFCIRILAFIKSFIFSFIEFELLNITKLPYFNWLKQTDEILGVNN
jgi:hypothetical protein